MRISVVVESINGRITCNSIPSELEVAAELTIEIFDSSNMLDTEQLLSEDGDNGREHDTCFVFQLEEDD